MKINSFVYFIPIVNISDKNKTKKINLNPCKSKKFFKIIVFANLFYYILLIRILFK